MASDFKDTQQFPLYRTKKQRPVFFSRIWSLDELWVLDRNVPNTNARWPIKGSKDADFCL